MRSWGVEMIAAERRRQIEEEGFGAEHDAQYRECELEWAALAYLGAGIAAQGGDDLSEPPPFWPWPAHWWKPSKDPVRNLVKAGALIAAEIDRLLAQEGGADGATY